MSNIEYKYFSDWTLKEWLIIILYTIISFRFYSYFGFSNTVLKFPQFISVFIMFFICRKAFIQKNENKFYCLMRGILLITFISIFSAYIFHNQSVMLGYRATASNFILLFYFYLYSRKPSLKSLELYILIFGLLYCLLWAFAMSMLPTPIFGYNEDGEMNDDESRGMVRINFVGRLSLIFAYFLSINRAYITRNKKYVILAIILFVFLVMQLTRQLILWTALVTIIYIFQKNRKLIIFSCIILCFAFLYGANIKFSEDSIIGSMIEMTENQLENNQKKEEDIRITQYRYMFTQWSPNVAADIIGNGMPHGDSTYGSFYYNLIRQHRIILADIGYGCMFVVTGWIGLILYLILFIRCCFTRIPEELMYAKMFMLFMIPANIAADWYAKADGQIAMCISVYLMTFYALPKRKGRRLGLFNS